MAPLPEGFETLRASVAAGDRLASWRAIGEAIAWLADLRNEAEPNFVRQVVRTPANQRWFDMAELLAGAAATRIDSTPGTRRLHAQMLMERGFSEEALSRLRSLLANPDLSLFDKG